MKHLQLGALMVVTMLSWALPAMAVKSLPTNDFFTEGQTWRIERISSTDPSDITEIEVTVGKGEYGDAMSEKNGKEWGFSANIYPLTIKANGVTIGNYAAAEGFGRLVVRLSASVFAKFQPFLQFDTRDQTSVIIGASTLPLSNVDYIFAGDYLRKRVECGDDDGHSTYIFGIGAKEWQGEFQGKSYTYRFVSMTTAQGTEIDETVFDEPKAECDNSYWVQDRRWKYVTYYPGGEEPDRYSYYKVEGETILGPTEGNLTCRDYKYCDSDWNTLESAGPVVSTNNQVYTYDEYGQRFMLEYDFNIEVGERALIWNSNSEVEAIDEINVNGRNFRRIIFEGASKGGDWKYWVDGIGADGENTLIENFLRPTDGSWFRFGACYQGDECIFTYEDFFTPSGVEINETEEQSQTTDDVMYDLQGRRVTNPEPGDITISNGQKVIYR